MIGSLLIGPPFLADFSLNEEFLTFLAVLGEGFCGFTPELKVDEVGDGFAVARLGQIGVVVGEGDFYEAFAVLGVGEFGIGDEVAGQQEFVDVHRVNWLLLVFYLCLRIPSGGKNASLSVMPAQRKFQPPLAARGDKPAVKDAIRRPTGISVQACAGPSG